MSDPPQPQVEQATKPKPKKFTGITIRKATTAEAEAPAFDAERLDMKPSSAAPVVEEPVTVVRGLFGKKAAAAVDNADAAAFGL